MDYAYLWKIAATVMFNATTVPMRCIVVSYLACYSCVHNVSVSRSGVILFASFFWLYQPLHRSCIHLWILTYRYYIFYLYLIFKYPLLAITLLHLGTLSPFLRCVFSSLYHMSLLYWSHGVKYTTICHVSLYRERGNFLLVNLRSLVT